MFGVMSTSGEGVEGGMCCWKAYCRCPTCVFLLEDEEIERMVVMKLIVIMSVTAMH